MIIIDSAVLTKIAPKASSKTKDSQSAIIRGIAPHLMPAMESGMITTFLRKAHFLAQICHESDGFQTLEEYASGEKYEGRLDLGNTQRGDGVRYKGRGLIQLTGRANYHDCGRRLGLALEQQPELAMEPRNAVLIACDFWKNKHINPICDRDDLRAVTRRVNGGLNGLTNRRTYLLKAEAELGGNPLPGVQPGVAAASPSTLTLGASGAAVSRLQRLLAMKGYAIAIDGEFGVRTRAAVNSYQSFAGLDADGVVGRETWDSLAAVGMTRTRAAAA